jgi:hypothetical protein
MVSIGYCTKNQFPSVCAIRASGGKEVAGSWKVVLDPATRRSGRPFHSRVARCGTGDERIVDWQQGLIACFPGSAREDDPSDQLETMADVSMDDELTVFKPITREQSGIASAIEGAARKAYPHKILNSAGCQASWGGPMQLKEAARACRGPIPMEEEGSLGGKGCGMWPPPLTHGAHCAANDGVDRQSSARCWMSAGTNLGRTRLGDALRLSLQARDRQSA